MKEFIDPFLYNVPRLDIHGYDRTGAVAVVKTFIDDYVRIEEHTLIVIHGKGEGILKTSVHEYLKHDERVMSYKLNNYNDGETIITLKGKN